MKALVFGVEPEPWTPPPSADEPACWQPGGDADAPDGRRRRPAAAARLGRHPAPLAGICGSDSKQALLDFGDEDIDNAMGGLCSFPQVMGHEVVADVVELGPEARGRRSRPAGGAQPVAVVRAARRVAAVPVVPGRRPTACATASRPAPSARASTPACRATPPAATPS